MPRARGSFDLVEMAGRKVNWLTVLSRSGPVAGSKQMWLCRCDCGNTTTVIQADLLRARTMSCGCYRKGLNVTHGLCGTPEYLTWIAMKARCESTNKRAYSRYGGRGIRVCDRWQQFETFLEDMGKRPSPDHSLDRIDNDGNYEPGNCRWATRAEQQANRRNTLFVVFEGERIPLSVLGARFGINYKRMYSWAFRGRSLSGTPLANVKPVIQQRDGSPAEGEKPQDWHAINQRRKPKSPGNARVFHSRMVV